MAERTIGGRYRLLERLGAGGMAAVWKAEDIELGRHVALKLLAPDADRARFEREARALASLTHPNVCRLFDYGEEAGAPYMVLELLPGGSLQDRLAPGRPLPDAETARIAGDIAAGLAAAHERGLVHRDLKPANILFDEEDHAKIADFGIARVAGGGTLTDPGTVLGTAAYISPEQAAGQPATPASDVYSFGVILYRMLAGRLPFESDDAAAVIAMHVHEPPRPITSLRRDVPANLDSVALAALAKDPADRPPNGSAVLAELQLPARPPIPAATQEATRTLRQAAERRRRVPRPAVVVAGLVLVATGAGAAIGVVESGDSGDEPAPSIPDISLGRVTGARTTDPPPPPPPPALPTATERTTTAPVTTPPPAATTTVETEPPVTPPPEPVTTAEPEPTTETIVTTEPAETGVAP